MLPRLYVITDRATAKQGAGTVEAACVAAANAGARLFQLRDKLCTPGKLYADFERLTTTLAGYGAQVMVNDRADIAVALGCDGVHRPQNGLPVAAIRRLVEYRWIAVSCHDARELLEAESEHADFVTFGPIFETRSKPDAKPVGLAGLSAAAKLIDLPIFALGGVTPDTARACLEAGAHGVAVLSGIMAAEDPFTATSMYLDAVAT